MSDRDRDDRRIEDIHDSDPDFDSIVHSGAEDKREVEPSSPHRDQHLSNRVVSVSGRRAVQRDERRVRRVVQPESQLPVKKNSIATNVDASTIIARHPISIVEPAADQPVAVDESEGEQHSQFELPHSAQQIGTGSFDNISSRSITQVRTQRETDVEDVESIGVIQTTEFLADTRALTNIVTPESVSAGGRPELESEMQDPGYDWTGGVPYATTTPQCIVHVDPPNYDSLQFLQRVLRDTYTELEGGRPRTETLRSRAGSLERTSVHGSIVTLDLTTDEWTIDLERERCSISNEGRDIVPELQAYLKSFYGGKLGYLVLNVSKADLGSRFRSDTLETLIETLADSPSTVQKPSSEDEYLSAQTPTIRLAEPRLDGATFRRVVRRYFGFDSEEPIADVNVQEIEAARDARLRANDWRRISLTERHQGSDGESDEHYFWKAALTEGIAWHMKRNYTQLHGEMSLDEFIEQNLLSESQIESEYWHHADSESGNSDGSTTDLYVRTEDDWAWSGMQDFLTETPITLSQGTPVSIEFETGRAEGAFNFRKLRETVEKHENTDGALFVVIPPRMLFRSQSRAQMIQQLVEGPSAPTDESDSGVALCIPQLGSYGCERLISAKILLNEWFGDAV